MLSTELVTAAYIGSSVLFILSLGGLSNQEKAKRGAVSYTHLTLPTTVIV